MKTDLISYFFYHSAGHNKTRPDGLNSNNMNKFYGGEQQKMRDSKINDESYLGPFDHPNKSKVGPSQKGRWSCLTLSCRWQLFTSFYDIFYVKKMTCKVGVILSNFDPK